MKILNPNPSPEEIQQLKDVLTPENLQQLGNKVEPLDMLWGHFPVAEGEKLEDIEERPLNTQGAPLVVPTQRRLHWFTLGPVYFLLKFKFSIVEMFKQIAEGKGATFYTFNTPFSLLPDIPGWVNVIEAVKEPEHWNSFVKFLGECGFYYPGQEAEGRVYGLYGTKIRFPYENTTFELNVFTPSGDRVKFGAFYDNEIGVRLCRLQPDMDRRFLEILTRSRKG